MAMASRVMAAKDLTADDLVARARALVPGLRERQREAERLGRIPSESIEEMKLAGLYRVLQPRAFGGLELGLDSFVRIGSEIASGCGSTGWVYTTGAQHQWQIGMFPRQAQEDVWGRDRLALSASSYAPTGTAVAVDGGYRVNGRWSFCSGIDVAQWIILGVRVVEEGSGAPKDGGFMLVPRADFRILDTWDVFGLVGTGSKDIELEDVFVPAHRFLSQAEAQSGHPPGMEVNAGDLFRIPFFAAITVCLCTAIVGMARGALEEYLADIRSRTTRGAALGAAQSVADFPTVQLRVGEASAAIDAATELVLRDCRDIMATVGSGRALTEEQRARNKGDLGFAVRLCVRAVDLLFDSTGGVGLYGKSRVQRFWRDLHAGSQHISLNWDAVGALYGRVRLGRPAGSFQF